MANKLVSKSSITINAPINKVWQALTDPAMIKEYLFGTTTITDWKKGSPISYEGEWEGKKYKDKGAIIDIVPEKLLHTTYWSSMGGKEDKPENYNNVIYELEPRNAQTIITISQDNIENEAQLEHMKQNWSIVLEGMKKLLEKK
jgi:uncharacterized protein YndB with AHSA1/START domain